MRGIEYPSKLERGVWFWFSATFEAKAILCWFSLVNSKGIDKCFVLAHTTVYSPKIICVCAAFMKCEESGLKRRNKASRALLCGAWLWHGLYYIHEGFKSLVLRSLLEQHGTCSAQSPAQPVTLYKMVVWAIYWGSANTNLSVWSIFKILHSIPSRGPCPWTPGSAAGPTHQTTRAAPRGCPCLA